MPVTRRHAAAALAALPLTLAATGTAHAATARTGAAPARGPGRPRHGGTVYIAGDSTAAPKTATAAPEAGWGTALPAFLGHGWTVANHAVNGRSSKSFHDEGRLAPILEAIRPGDLLLVQFGHNDEKTGDPARGTDPYTTYQDYLRRYVDGARARGALPVLLTPVERRRFGADGRARPTHGEYPEAMRALAAAEGVPLVDVQAASLAEWDRLGPDGTLELFLHLAPGEHPNHPGGKQDNTHFRPRGAIEVARMAARGLKERRLPHPGAIRRLDDAVPESVITWTAG
ncbi:rhamnogalacturonan acetylesterase [Streptomyces sp. DH37]|uniref:rhamnogalacturonan acetylesterase n=1 Tax=Streptomyces sp. DH37 TaxID=3040122 RepID=UPI002442866E|nr:rhamnogalacturonan acetylesterase [Streptomyces sp. DH37]MDG9705111.1 rhamnogalacturonan acetylesterase [Streptomyces sp. DH37]